MHCCAARACFLMLDTPAQRLSRLLCSLWGPCTVLLQPLWRCQQQPSGALDQTLQVLPRHMFASILISMGI